MSLFTCTNNRNHPDLVVGLKRIGTRYECLKRGIGLGRNLPFDPSYAVDYDPIDRTRTYCGLQNRKPMGYNRMGSPSSCLRTGVGIGRRMRALQGRRAAPRRPSPRRPSPQRRRRSPPKKPVKKPVRKSVRKSRRKRSSPKKKKKKKIKRRK
jgi:hypothetical protein